MPFNDVRGIVEAAREKECTLTLAFTLQVSAQILVMFCTLPRPSSRSCSACEVGVQACIVGNQLRAFAVIRHIFGGVATCFGDECSKFSQEVEANRVLLVNGRIFRSLQYAGIEIFSIH